MTERAEKAADVKHTMAISASFSKSIEYCTDGIHDPSYEHPEHATPAHCLQEPRYPKQD